MRLAIKTAFIFTILVILSCMRAVKPVQFPAEPDVRVALLTDQERVTISATAPFTVASGNDKKILKPGALCRISHLNTVTVQGVVWLKEAKFPIQVKLEANGLVKITGRTYRGYVEIRKDPDGKLTVINILPLEKYLCGVVPCEIGWVKGKNLEAVKAQAIAARSYTISHFGRFKNLGFDVFAASQRDQEYQGAGVENELTSEAVYATFGLVATHRNQAIEAKYHSTCGGITVGAKAPYLRTISDTPNHRKTKKPFCHKSPHYTWRRNLSQKELMAILAKIIPKLDPKQRLKTINLAKDGKTQRNRTITFTIGRNRYKLDSEVFRQALDLKSNYYSIKAVRRNFIIVGHGYGHGIGLCQFGSLEMAKKGYSCEQIINHYYSGTKVQKIY